MGWIKNMIKAGFDSGYKKGIESQKRKKLEKEKKNENI